MTVSERLIAPVQEPASGGLGLDGLGLLLRRRARVMLLVIFAVVAAAAAYLQTAEERFRARATLVLTLSETRVNRTAVELESFELSRAIVETELDVLRSRQFAGALAEALSLAEHPAFVPEPGAPAMGEGERSAAIIDKLLASYSVFRSGESLAIEIVAETVDAELAAAIANGVARTYIDLNARRQRDEIEHSIAFLEQRVETLLRELNQAEIELADFIRENDLDDADMVTTMHAEESRLSAILTVIGSSPSERAEAAAVSADLAAVQERLRNHTRAELALLRREWSMDVLRSRYQLSVERLNDMEMQLDFVAQSARQVTVAEVPVGPSSPNREVTLGLSLVAAAALAFVAALIADTFNRRTWSEEDTLRVTGLRNLGGIPRLRRRGLFFRSHAPLRTLVDRPPPAFAEALRGILTLLANSSRGDGPKVLMVTSSLPNEGKSTVAVSLAASAALDGLSVLLVDLDAHRGGATAFAGAKAQQISLEELADGEAAPDGLRVPSPVLRGLDVLSLGVRGRMNPHVVRAAQARLMPLWRDTYDLVVIDTPPVLVLDDACRVGQLADQVLIVARWGRTSTDILREAYERLARNGIEVAGTVLNDVDARTSHRYRTGAYFAAKARRGRIRARA